MEINKKKEVIDACLKMFVSKGLFETTSRDLSKSLQLQSGGLYYYFKSKDEVVLACAEEAAIRLEEYLIIPALDQLNDPDQMMKLLKVRAEEMAPMMQFLTQVATADKYKEQLKPSLGGLSKRYKEYAQQFADHCNCELEVIEPYVYMCITAVANYMIFGEETYILPQINLTKEKIKQLMIKGD